MESITSGPVLVGSILVAGVAISAYRWLKRSRTASQVRARSEQTADTYTDELEVWLSGRLSARWLVESAYSAARATMTPQAVAFYNELAEKWNDEVGWAERRLLVPPAAAPAHARTSDDDPSLV